MGDRSLPNLEEQKEQSLRVSREENDRLKKSLEEKDTENQELKLENDLLRQQLHACHEFLRS